MKTSYGLEYNVLPAERLNEFEGYDRSIAEIQIANCGKIIVDTTYNQPIDNEYDLAEIYEQLETEQLRPIDPKRMIEDIWDILLHNTKYITPEIFLAKYHKYFDCIDCSKGIIYLTDGADTYKLSLEKTTPIDEIVI